MNLKTQIDADIKKAMLAKQKDELIALRAIKSAILLAETASGAKAELTEEEGLKLLTKAVKQRKDSAALFEKEGRKDLADKEILEYELISKYLPQQLSEEELKAAIEKIVADTGASGMQDMGKVMGMASKNLAGKAEGKAISILVKSILAG
jgi:uncharacterized protein YqeY